MFEIVHTIDGEFFFRALKQIEDAKLNEVKAEEKVEMDMKMLALLETMREDDHTRSRGSGLGQLKLNSRKRKKPMQREIIPITTSVEVGRTTLDEDRDFGKLAALSKKRVKLN